MTEHSVTYEVPGGTRTITREVFVAGGRILGTETISERVWRGWDGWKGASVVTDTRHFETSGDAAAWFDVMFRDREVAAVAAAGGTKLVFAT